MVNLQRFKEHLWEKAIHSKTLSLEEEALQVTNIICYEPAETLGDVDLDRYSVIAFEHALNELMIYEADEIRDIDEEDKLNQSLLITELNRIAHLVQCIEKSVIVQRKSKRRFI